jgi:hypothetical protein
MKYDADREVAVSLGSLDDAADIEPNYSIWTSERLPLAVRVDAHLPQFQGDPTS